MAGSGGVVGTSSKLCARGVAQGWGGCGGGVGTARPLQGERRGGGGGCGGEAGCAAGRRAMVWCRLRVAWECSC